MLKFLKWYQAPIISVLLLLKLLTKFNLVISHTEISFFYEKYKITQKFVKIEIFEFFGLYLSLGLPSTLIYNNVYIMVFLYLNIPFLDQYIQIFAWMYLYQCIIRWVLTWKVHETSLQSCYHHVVQVSEWFHITSSVYTVYRCSPFWKKCMLY